MSFKRDGGNAGGFQDRGSPPFWKALSRVSALLQSPAYIFGLLGLLFFVGAGFAAQVTYYANNAACVSYQGTVAEVTQPTSTAGTILDTSLPLCNNLTIPVLPNENNLSVWVKDINNNWNSSSMIQFNSTVAAGGGDCSNMVFKVGWNRAKCLAYVKGES